MVFSLINRLVSGVKGGVSASLKSVSDISGAIVGAVKGTITTTIKESSDFLADGINAAA